MTDLLPCPFCGSNALLHHDRSSDYERNWTFVVYCSHAQCAADGGHHRSKEQAIFQWNTRADTKRIIIDFYNEVCDQAERNMAATNTVSGAHWNAMRQVLKTKGIEVSR